MPNKIRCEQFIHAHFDGVGYRTIATPNLDNIITQASLRYLKELQHDSVTWLPENYLAVTRIYQTKDEFERNTLWNHTILMSAQDFPTFLEALFIEPTKKIGKLELEQAEIEIAR